MNHTHINIDCTRHLGVIQRIWAAIGYDELNWTYTERGKALYDTLGKNVFTAGNYYVRMHNTFTSGNGLSAPAWGAGNVYHTMPDDSVQYDWHILDQTFDTITQNGGIPFVELGFTPRDLTQDHNSATGFTPAMDVGREPYELGAWKQPPSNYERWGDLVQAFVQHVVARYGADMVKRWRFELWNEPDIANYWHGTPEDYVHLYDVTEAAVRSVLPEAAVGGPATTGEGQDFLEQFLAHLSATGRKPDFISFHTKGAAFTPRRVYNPFAQPARDSHSTPKMVGDIERSLAVVAKFAHLHDVPVYVDECDPAVGTVYGMYDNPNFVITNGEHYPTFMCQLVARMLDHKQIAQLTHWAFYMEGKRWFEGNRTLVDNENIEKPVLNGLRLLEMLAGAQRLPVISDNEQVGALAAQTTEGWRILLWHHIDAWWEKGITSVTMVLAGVTTAKPNATLWRIDQTHANAFRAWQALGSPAAPSVEQIALLRKQGALQAESLPIIKDAAGVRVQLEMPLYGMAMIEIAAT